MCIYIYYACFLSITIPGEPNCQPTMFGGFNNPCLVICAIVSHWLYQITIQITIQHLLYVYNKYIRVFFQLFWVSYPNLNHKSREVIVMSLEYVTCQRCMLRFLQIYIYMISCHVHSSKVTIIICIYDLIICIYIYIYHHYFFPFF